MTQTTPTRRDREEGFVLLSVLILLVVFVIAMSVAAPRIAASIQRDRDVETMERGKQYIRAIQLYYRKFHSYPPNVDALVKTNDIRFLRKRYLDPITDKDDWKPLYFGQNKQPIAFGFFGQPLGGTGGAVLAGTGPSGGNGLPGAASPGTGLSDGSNSGTAGAITGTGTGNSGSGTTDANGNPTNGPTFGGGGIIGFSPASPKKSILTYKKMNHYNQWEFTYSPLMDQQMMAGGNTGSGLPTNGIGQPGVGQPGIGQPPGFGPTNGGGSTPIQPPPSTPPQQ